MLVPNGYTVVPPVARLAQITQCFIDAYGSGFNTDPSTPQGLLIQNLTNQFIELDTQYLNLSYSINPQIATNQSLDAIAQFDYIERNRATYTQVTCQLTGLPSVIIPQGSVVLDTFGNEYASLGNIALDDITGEGEGVFQAVQRGAIIANAGTVTRIFQQQTGWDSVNNTDAGVTGTPIEPDYAFRARRTTAIFRGTQLVQAMNATINEIVSVTPVQCGVVFNNVSNSPITGGIWGSITIPVGYIAIVLLGGADIDVENWAYQYITGCGTVLGGVGGGRALSVTPPAPPTLPPYTVNIFVPTQEQLYITINASAPAGSNALLSAMIQNAIYNDYTTNRAVYQLIGQHVSNWQFASYVNAIAISTSSIILIQSIFVGTAPSPSGSTVAVNNDTALLIPTNANIVVNITFT